MAKRRKKTEVKDQKLLEIGYLRNLAKEDPTALTRNTVIKQAMSDKGYSVSDVLKKANISFQLFSMFMAGRVNIQEEDLNKIAEILEVDPDSIMQKIPYSSAGAIIGRISDDFSNNQEKLLSGAKSLTEDGQTEKDDNTNSGATVDNPSAEDKPTDSALSVESAEGSPTNLSDNKATDNTTKSSAGDVSESEKEKISDITDMQNTYVPKTEELLAAYTLFNNEGKAKFFEMAWDILKNPRYRVGGGVS